MWFDRWLGNVATQCKRVWAARSILPQYAGFAVSQVLAATVARQRARGAHEREQLGVPKALRSNANNFSGIIGLLAAAH